jgi:error-prone DNA polymerase
MVHPYLRRRAGHEPVTYPSEAIREVLHKTLGVPIFQEQAMRLAVVAAGFTPGEADQLRRAMGAWRRPGIIDQFGQKLIDGMLARGLSRQFAEQVFQQIRGFGEYGFPESHAASFAKLVYVSAWLKCHHQAAFTAALLNSQPMGFYSPAQLVRDARQHGVEVRGVDVNHSRWDCTLEEGGGECGVRSAECGVLNTEHSVDTPHSALRTPHSLRLGFRQISGFPQAAAEAIESARRLGPFRSLEDLVRRTCLSRAVLLRLAQADAFGSLGHDRRQALWEALGQDERHRPLPLFDNQSEDAEHPQDQAAFRALPSMSPQDAVKADYAALGLSLRGHPLAFCRAELDSLGVTPAGRLAARAGGLGPDDHSKRNREVAGNAEGGADSTEYSLPSTPHSTLRAPHPTNAESHTLHSESRNPQSPHGRLVKVAGLVLLRQRPSTAKGITFVTLEDETGTANLIVHQRTWEKFYTVARRSPAWLATGRLECKESVIHVIVSRIEDLSARLGELRSVSRDFR